jgi:hypothetical protein
VTQTTQEIFYNTLVKKMPVPPSTINSKNKNSFKELEEPIYKAIYRTMMTENARESNL